MNNHNFIYFIIRYQFRENTTRIALRFGKLQKKIRKIIWQKAIYLGFDVSSNQRNNLQQNYCER